MIIPALRGRGSKRLPRAGIRLLRRVPPGDRGPVAVTVGGAYVHDRGLADVIFGSAGPGGLPAADVIVLGGKGAKALRQQPGNGADARLRDAVRPREIREEIPRPRSAHG